jgi:hypothetical protein
MSTPQEFKVGDKVKACGVNGVVTKIVNGLVGVKFDLCEEELCFYSDGKYFVWQKTPTLKHRKFKKREVPMEIFVNAYQGRTIVAHLHRESSNFGPMPERVGGKAWRYVLAKDQSK